MSEANYAGSARRLRSDLKVAEIDGDLVIYDHARGTSTVLSGGAVAVWRALATGAETDLVERVAESVSHAPPDIESQVVEVVGRLHELGYLTAASSSG